jgi:hypothetical protein
MVPIPVVPMPIPDGSHPKSYLLIALYIRSILPQRSCPPFSHQISINSTVCGGRGRVALEVSAEILYLRLGSDNLQKRCIPKKQPTKHGPKY